MSLQQKPSLTEMQLHPMQSERGPSPC
uniref:Uncharacterized protein n=1 Tax=Rhizophora mucronata TaxID=61149 RepID=A0A2P2JDU6_RHIMU